jgi:hypothetical protein
MQTTVICRHLNTTDMICAHQFQTWTQIYAFVQQENSYRTTPWWFRGNRRHSVPNLSTRWPEMLSSLSGERSNGINRNRRQHTSQGCYDVLKTRLISFFRESRHNSSIWRSWYRASLMYSFKYNQQDSTLYNILYCCQCSTASVGELARDCQLTHASGSSKEAWHIPDAVSTVWAPDDGWKNRLKHVPTHPR